MEREKSPTAWVMCRPSAPTAGQLLALLELPEELCHPPAGSHHSVMGKGRAAGRERPGRKPWWLPRVMVLLVWTSFS